MKQLGSDAAGDAFATDSKCLVEVSVVAYSFAKFLEKPYMRASGRWKDFEEESFSALAGLAATARAGK
ncbi:TPA: hypothetical protein HA318_03575, partial [Candidatus Micrarchaeota archaeon]|nr:hypothetical protein [Candidatus Micrarchaeota archaeon]